MQPKPDLCKPVLYERLNDDITSVWEDEFQITPNQDILPPDEDELSSETKELNIREVIKDWYLESIPSKVQLDSLLKKLKPFHNELPKCQKTLLSTKAYSEIPKKHS